MRAARFRGLARLVLVAGWLTSTLVGYAHRSEHLIPSIQRRGHDCDHHVDATGSPTADPDVAHEDHDSSNRPCGPTHDSANCGLCQFLAQASLSAWPDDVPPSVPCTGDVVPIAPQRGGRLTSTSTWARAPPA